MWQFFLTYLREHWDRSEHEVEANQVLAFFVFLGERGRSKSTFHAKTCDRNRACSCPTFSSVATLQSYRSALRAGLNESGFYHDKVHPVDNLRVDSFFASLSAEFVASRISTKQAHRITSTVFSDVVATLDFNAAFERDDKAKWILQRNLCIVTFMFQFGCRASDVLRLKVGDLELHEDHLNVTFFHSKTSLAVGPRRVELHSAEDDFDVIQRIRDLNLVDNHSLIFTNWTHRSSPDPPNISSAVINKFIKASFGAQFTSHSLRVSKACNLKDNGDDDVSIASSLHMKSPLTAKRYAQQSLKFVTSPSGKRQLSL